MCDPTYPTFRSASILKARPGLNAAQAVLAGQGLSNADSELSHAMVRKISTLPKVARARPSSGGWELRARISPAVTIDFRPIEFDWSDTPIQFRACMTTSIGDRKAKIWTRYNFVNVETHKETVASFFHWVEEHNASVQDECVDFYNNQLKKVGIEAELTRTYMITIKMISTANPKIRADLERELTGSYEDEPEESEKVYAILAKELREDCGFELPVPDGKNTRLVGFRYPRRSQQLQDSDKADLPNVPAPPITDESFEALCLVQHDENGLHITGIAHEPTPPDDFRNSAPHVVSGEISFEIGNAY
jgi:hypothetical protein